MPCWQLHEMLTVLLQQASTVLRGTSRQVVHHTCQCAGMLLVLVTTLIGSIVASAVAFGKRAATWGLLSSLCLCQSETMYSGTLEWRYKTGAQRAMWVEARAIVRRLRADAEIGNRNGRLFVGPPGSGKTALLRSIAKHAHQHGLRVVWLSILPTPSAMPHRSIFSKLFGCTGGLEAYRTGRHRYPSPPSAILYYRLLQLQTDVALPTAHPLHHITRHAWGTDSLGWLRGGNGQCGW